MAIQPFPGQPPDTAQVTDQPQNRAPSQAQVTGTGGTLVVNSDGSLNTDATPVLPAATTLTEVVVNISSATGDQTLITHSGTTTIKVYRAILSSSAAISLTMKNGASAITGAIPVSSSVPVVLCFAPYPWFRTTSTNDLILNLSSTASIGGSLSVIQS